MSDLANRRSELEVFVFILSILRLAPISQESWKMIPASKLAALWEEVQGDCDLTHVQQALAASPKPAELVLDGWSPLQYLCENRAVGNAVRAEGISLLVRAGIDCNFVDEVF